MYYVFTITSLNSLCDIYKKRKLHKAVVPTAHLVVVHPPELDLPVVSSGHNEGHGGVEGGPVDAPIVALQHVLHHRVRLYHGT